MTRLVLKRLALSIPLLLVVSMITFVLVSLSPTNVAYTLLGARATPAQIALVQRQLGLDLPVWHQYLNWLRAAVHGDLGFSLTTHQPVADAVGQRLEPTIALLFVSMLVITVVGVGLGIIGALRGGWIARLIDMVGLLGIAVPSFVVGIALIVVFAVRLHALPSVGYSSISGGLGPWARSLTLPVAALAVGSIGLLAKQVRASVLDALDSSYIRTLTANGFSRTSIVYKHVLRSAAVPVLAVMGVTLVGLLGASVLIEEVFGIPGIGGLAVQSTLAKDLPVVQGVTVVFTLVVVVVDVVLDVVYALVNPRVRVS